MARRDDGWDDDYYGPSEGNPLNLLEQAVEGNIQQNPLMYGRPSIYDQYREPVETPEMEGISPEVAAANPLIAPPRPVKYMPIEQQIFWNERQAQELAKQASLQNTLNTNKANAREAQMKLDQEAQSYAILDSLDELNPSADDYEEKKGKLFAANPLGAMSDGVQRAIGWKDKAYESRIKFAEQERGQKIKRQEQADATRTTEAFKQASEINDPGLTEEVSRLSAQNPEAALAAVQRKKKELNAINTIVQLRDLGVSDEEITRKYGSLAGDNFLDVPAKAHLETLKRTQGKAVPDKASAIDKYRALKKDKAEASTREGIREGKVWTDFDERLLNDAQKTVSVFAPELVTAEAAPPAPSRPSTPSQRLTPALVSPAGVPQRVPVTQQPAGMTRTKKTPVAEEIYVNKQTGEQMIKRDGNYYPYTPPRQR